MSIKIIKGGSFDDLPDFIKEKLGNALMDDDLRQDDVAERPDPSHNIFRKQHWTKEEFDQRTELLMASAKRFTKGNPFKVGDLVTPMKGHMLTHMGLPCVVVEVFDEPMVDPCQDATSHQFRREMDMRVMLVLNTQNVDHIVMFCVESFTYELWTPEHEAALITSNEEDGAA